MMRFTITGLAVAAGVLLAPIRADAQSADWTNLRDDRFGVSITYPAGMFVPAKLDEPGMRAFRSDDGKAKFLVGARDNGKGDSPESFRRSLLKNPGRYSDVTYRPSGGNWFVLSGFRGDEVYYEKIAFSCDRQVVNVFAISYPVADRDRYDHVVERMEDSFHAGRACSGRTASSAD